jgi:hypothetical protein
MNNHRLYLWKKDEKMNGNNPLHKKIKDKIEQHEFDFDQNAWAKMETMLNEKSSPNVENTETKSFSTFKIIGIMTTLIIVFFVIFRWTDASLDEN